MTAEIVEFINNHRQANGNETVLAHSDFLKKVPEVLGHFKDLQEIFPPSTEQS